MGRGMSAVWVIKEIAIMTDLHSPKCVLRLPEVIARVGLCRASIYKMMTCGSFPRPIAIGIRARGWLESEIDTWIALRMQAR